MKNERTLKVEEVLRRPIFENAKLVAGTRGLYRTIRWVHVLENAEFTSYLKGGELILSTGVDFGENATKRLLYLDELIQRKAAGLVIELGKHIPEIPVDMLELADHHEFPLIVFEQRVHFVDITLDLHESIINKHNQALRDLEAYSRDLQQITLQTTSLRGIIRRFQEKVRTQTFFLTTDEPPLFVPTITQNVQNEMMELLERTLLSTDSLPETSGLIRISDKKQIFYQPVMAMGHVLGYLGIVLYERESDEILSLTLDNTVTAIAQILLRKMFAVERSLANQNRLLEDILQNKIIDEDQITKVLGINPKLSPIPSYWTAIIEIQLEKQRYTDVNGSPFHDLLPVFRSILTRHGFRPLLHSKGHRLYLLLLEISRLSHRREQLRNSLAEIERTFSQSLDLRIGISGISKDYAKIYHAFREAEQVLGLAGEFESPFFEDLGVYRLLIQTEGSYTLNSFVEDYLGPLIRHDEKHDSQLLTTLRIFLEHGQSKQEASERLFIRRQTLYHRLEKIQKLIGDNYLSPQNRLCLELALYAYDWLNRK